MVACLDVQAWRVSTRDEVSEFLKASGQRSTGKRQLLAIRTHLRPVDVYAYLRVRFGEPNGFQNFLRKDDSDNIVHWDFQLKAGQEDVYICGHLREVHFLLSEKLSDEQWKELINAIKADYRRVATDKSTFTRSLEKYVIFQNKFVAIAGLCADLHQSISDAPAPIEAIYPNEEAGSQDAFKQAMEGRSKRIEALFGDCLKLRLLMPIMAEAFINTLILTFVKNAIRDNAVLYNNFLRSTIPERLELLSVNCDGFVKPVNKAVPGYAHFMRIINKRNFALHGNVDPVREQIEVVYFDKRRPLFVNPENNIELLFSYMETHADSAGLLKEYEQLHGFLIEITECLSPRNKKFFEQVVSDAYPGYETKKLRPTRLFPDHYVWAAVQGTRYDDQLKVDW
jgi:hypothetical protein